MFASISGLLNIETRDKATPETQAKRVRIRIILNLLFIVSPLTEYPRLCCPVDQGNKSIHKQDGIHNTLGQPPEKPYQYH